MCYLVMVMSKIISRFYLITIAEKPVYVGVTYRQINIRFREHKWQKELPANARIKSIGHMTHEFTWDIDIVNKNAREVSDQEALLVDKYDTQNSAYQKALGGGSAWSAMKHFVTANQENDFWQGIAESFVLEVIKKIHDKKVRLSGVVYHTRANILLENAVFHTENTQRIRSVIARVKDTQRLESVITHSKNSVRLENVVNHTMPSRKLSNTIYDTNGRMIEE